MIADDALRLGPPPDPPADRARRQPALQRRRAGAAASAGPVAGDRHGLVLVQAEVADRLAAPPGGKVYGGPSVKLAWYVRAERAGSVPRSVFWPVPNVDSGLVRLVRTAPPALPAGVGRATCSRSSTPPSPSGARCCVPRWPAWAGSARGRIDPRSRPGRSARPSRDARRGRFRADRLGSPVTVCRSRGSARRNMQTDGPVAAPTGSSCGRRTGWSPSRPRRLP